MNLGHLSSDTNVSRASSFFIEDILLSKPKQLCREYGNLSALIRPALPAEYGYHCIPTPPMFFPHMLSHVQGLAAKHAEHPFLVPSSGKYCKLKNFRENFIFANSVMICDVKISRLEDDLPTSVNGRVISPFRECFYFAKLRFCEVSRNKTRAKISKLQ